MTLSDTERLKAWLGRGVELEAALVAHHNGADREETTCLASAVLPDVTASGGSQWGHGTQASEGHLGPTLEGLRALMSSWLRRDALLAAAATAAFVRRVAWVRDAMLLDVLHWALGPWKWCPP